MGEVRFENPGEEYGPSPVASSGFDMSGMLVKWGLVSSRKEAEYILIGIGILALVIAVFVYMSSLGSSNVPTQPNFGNATY